MAVSKRYKDSLVQLHKRLLAYVENEPYPPIVMKEKLRNHINGMLHPLLGIERYNIEMAGESYNNISNVSYTFSFVQIFVIALL